MKKENIEGELPPFLQDLKGKETGYKVPEGYFDAMEDAVFARLKAAGDLERPAMSVVKRPERFPLFVRPRVAAALAAALALVLAAVWFFRSSESPLPEAQYASTELTEDDIEAYVLENVQSFEPEQLAALATTETTETLEENAPTVNKHQPITPEELHPDDLDKILDEMTDEELEEIL